MVTLGLATGFFSFKSWAHMSTKPSLKSSTEECLNWSKKVIEALRQKQIYITAVESCTGGGLMHFLTATPGASDVITDGFVTYCDDSKIKLGVPAEVIQRTTVYSSETAESMARAGIKAAIKADIGIGITGVLSKSDPKYPNASVGEVHVAIVDRKEVHYTKCKIQPTGVRWLDQEQVIAHTLREIYQVVSLQKIKSR
jgi:PncC family amidohydrolase